MVLRFRVLFGALIQLPSEAGTLEFVHHLFTCIHCESKVLSVFYFANSERFEGTGNPGGEVLLGSIEKFIGGS
ncbi:hypothetical protein Fmac_002557 [Flemingia macrophylla]|uniref:Secreted protein n=1 Tax=Flemingia macrophylla TaxID=520843 RepID=A0ABD1NLM2_9FABA